MAVRKSHLIGAAPLVSQQLTSFMIYGSIKNPASYAFLASQRVLASSFGWLRSAPTDISDGEVSFEEFPDATIRVMVHETKPLRACRYEPHRKFIALQYISSVVLRRSPGCPTRAWSSKATTWMRQIFNSTNRRSAEVSCTNFSADFLCSTRRKFTYRRSTTSNPA